MKAKQVVSCALPNWYPDFKNITIKSRILEIPPDFLEYLLSDGTVVLPKGSLGPEEANNQPSTSEGNEEIDWDDHGSENEAECPSFPQFEAQIRRAINALGGSVFPKLNWSSPKDASWIACNNTLKCIDPGDVYLLLKSSEFITHDLTQPFVHCSDCEAAQSDPAYKIDYKLVLRRWHELNPGGEFRCFVKNKQIIGITQRHCANHYDFIAPHRKAITEDILNFYNRAIKAKFPENDYVFDVYRKDKGKVHLVDFNPFGSVTDSLLFGWDELENSDGPLKGSHDDEFTDLPPFRYIISMQGVQPSPYMQYGMPQDFIDLSTGSDPLKLVDFLQLQIQSQNSESSDEEVQPSS